MSAAIRLYAVILHVADVVVVEVDRNRHSIKRSVRVAVSSDIHAIVEIRNMVISHDVSRSVDLYGVFGNELGARSVLLPGAARKTHQVIRRKAAADDVVGDVEILRPRPIRVKGASDVFDVTLAKGYAGGARDVLQTGEKREIGVTNCQAFEVIIVSRHYVKQVEVPVAIENRFAV